MTARLVALAVVLTAVCLPSAASAAPLDVDVEGPRELGSRTLARSLPGRGPAAVSIDVRIRPGSRLVLFGSVELRRTGSRLIVSSGKRRRSVRSPGGVHHVEALTGAAPGCPSTGSPSARRCGCRTGSR